MKLKLERLSRGVLLALLLLVIWAVWASAQPEGTNTASLQTNAPGLFKKDLLAIQQDSVTFGLDRIPLLRKEAFGQPLWKYLASLIYIFLAFYVSKLMDYLFGAWLKKWAERTETKFDDLLVALLRGPVKVVAFVIFLHIGLNLFKWPPLVESLLTKAFIILVACSLTYLVLKLVDLVVGLWRERTTIADADKEFDMHLMPLVRKSLKVFVIIVAVLVTSQNLGINITGAIASLSIGGLALGLAAQDTLANLFGAVAVYVDKPFRIGDRIQLDSVDGTVENIGLRSTRVRNLDGHLVTIPNKTVGNATITNISRRPNIKTVMNFGITYDTPQEKVKRALGLLQEIYGKHPMTADLIIGFNKFADSALNIMVVHWWNETDYKMYVADMQELNLQIKDRFDAEGISFAFPSQTVYLRQDSEWKLAERQILSADRDPTSGIRSSEEAQPPKPEAL